MLYLLYIGRRHLARSLGLCGGCAGAARVEHAAGGQAVLLNILNPKLTLFPGLSAAVHASWQRGAAGHLLGLSGVFMAMTFAVFVAYGAGPRLPPHGD